MNASASRRFPFRKFLGLSMGVPLGLLLLAEGACRLLPEKAASRASLLVGSTDGKFLEVSPAFLSSFHPQRIPARKPAGVLRILCLGGSSTYGFPFGAGSAFPHWLQQLLDHFHPDAHARVFNFGAMSYGSRRILRLMPEFLSLQPDLIILYSGHNEFVEQVHAPQQSRTRKAFSYSCLFRRLCHSFGGKRMTGPEDAPEVYRETIHLQSEPKRELVIAAFRRNYSRILDACRAAGVPEIAATVPSNIREWRPDGTKRFRSGNETEWRNHFKRGKDLVQKKQFPEAVKELSAALATDPTHAELQFLAGRALLAMGRVEQAKKALVLARDWDAAPQRALSAINEIIRTEAQKSGARLADIVALFEKRSPHGLIGHEWIEDYVHPTVPGHRLIASELYRALPGLPGLEKRRSAPEALTFLNSLEKARPAGKDRAAFFYNLGLKFINQKNWKKVVECNRETVRANPNHALGYNNLGRGLQELGQLEEALECYRKAARLRPDIAGIHLNLAAVYQGLGKLEEATVAGETAIRLRPQDARAHYVLATILSAQKNMPRAIEQYREAIRLQPDYFEAHANLGLAYALTGQKKLARKSWQRALELRPREPVVTRWLKELGKQE